MLSSRLWLSITAFASAVMILWTLVSANLVSPIGFGPAGTVELGVYGAVSAVVAIVWLRIYFRQRGDTAAIGSRFSLSLCGALLGAAAARAMLHFGVIAPLSLSSLPTGEFVLFVACTALPLLIWATIFFVTRAQENFRRYENLRT